MIDSERYTVDKIHTVPRKFHPRQFSEKKKDTHLMFGEIHSVYNPLSNWYPCKIKFHDHEFDSSEQAYQWTKTDYCKDVAAAEKLLYTTSPRLAKDLGLTVTVLKGSDWDKKKNGVMEQILKIEFKDNIDLQKYLLETENIQLAEAGRDNHWTVGLVITRDDLFDTKK